MSSLKSWSAAAIVVFSLAVIAGLTGSTLASGPAVADEKADARAREIQELVTFLKTQGYYGLRDPKSREATAKLQAMSEQAAPAVAEMLTEGLKNRKEGWIEVYAPIFILKGMGEHAKVALPELIKALSDEHLINVVESARVLANIGPAAIDAVPALERVWKSLDIKDEVKTPIGSAIKKIDPRTAVRLAIP